MVQEAEVLRLIGQVDLGLCRSILRGANSVLVCIRHVELFVKNKLEAGISESESEGIRKGALIDKRVFFFVRQNNVYVDPRGLSQDHQPWRVNMSLQTVLNWISL